MSSFPVVEGTAHTRVGIYTSDAYMSTSAAYTHTSTAFVYTSDAYSKMSGACVIRVMPVLA